MIAAQLAGIVSAWPAASTPAEMAAFRLNHRFARLIRSGRAWPTEAYGQGGQQPKPEVCCFPFFFCCSHRTSQQPVNNAAPDLPAAIQLAQEGRNAEALAALQKIAASNPDDQLTRLWIASVHDRMGHPDLAEPIYHSIVLEDPRNVDALVGLGTVAPRNRTRSRMASMR